MIPPPALPAHPDRHPELRAADWRRQWRESIRDPRELLAALGLQDQAARISDAAAAAFPLRVPRAFLSRMPRSRPVDTATSALLREGPVAKALISGAS